MDSAKRKRKANGAIDEKTTKVLETNEKQTTTTTTSSTSSTTTIEDEVEEFYAILRRFHTAVRYYKKEKNKESKFKQKDLRFDQLKGMEETVGGGKRKREEVVEENLVLDLNVVPNTDTNNST
ncbi:hypothetical protein FRX31_028390 [Thalictrum thalictroides]|uniref:Uncharacterized protein n=1 Tax=Thalictrum thalictroides TaxID=46969 RepID=A0A7J6VAU5_THATH|nr:hypothetical protein FRX31_028390 [Thalictrum thalictroides]